MLVRRFRGGELESLHHGCWAVVDVDGTVIAHAGDAEQPIFARSASKSMQALGSLDAGAGDRIALTDEHRAVMISSHNGEPVHERVVGEMLAALDLDESILRCGHAAPFDEPKADKRRIVHNCSGKHAGFLTGAIALGQDPTTYLDPEGDLQKLVQRAVAEVAALEPGRWKLAVDGCSAPTFVLPLRNLAQGIARVANPDGLSAAHVDHCRRMVKAATAHPHLVGGTSPARFDTELLAASGGRLFAKGGADGVQVIGVVGADIAFAGKADDGNQRGLLPVAVAVLERLGHIDAAVSEAVAEWIDPMIRNADGLEVGQQVMAPLPL